MSDNWTSKEQGMTSDDETVQALIPAATRDERQAAVASWARRAFGIEQATSLPQRGTRLLEEAIEAFQAAGADRAMAHRLVNFVFDRPVGDLRQELGGVGVCVLALADALGTSADAAERDEIERVLGRPLEHFRERNDRKNEAGFLAVGRGSVPEQDLGPVGQAPIAGGGEIVSISDLRAKRAAMDGGPWSFDVPESPAGSVDICGAECRCDDADDTVDPPASVLCPKHEHVAEWVTLPNATGIVATHSAAEVLIQIASAALAWRQATDDRRTFGEHAYRSNPLAITTHEHRSRAAELDGRVHDCADALRAALDRVRP